MSSYRTIVHVDMDAFYAAVECLDHPEYVGKPLIVGADPKDGRGRGVVSTCSYEARVFGVRSAMPISKAYRLCPHGIYVAPNFPRYSELSRAIMAILGGFSPIVEQVSIDEAFLDCTGAGALFGPPEQLGRSIKTRIREETRLTASVGIAPNKYIAKVGSDLNKPDGLTICRPGEEREFLAKLPVERLWGAGARTVEKLKRLGFYTIGELAAASRESVERRLGTNGMHFWLLANGVDDREVAPHRRRKSISEERTYAEDIEDPAEIDATLFAIADELARRMRREGVRGRTVHLKLRLSDFETLTRSTTLETPVDDLHSLLSAALEMLARTPRNGKRVRLLGIGASNLVFEGDADSATGKGQGAQQPDLFAAPADRAREKARRRELLLDQLKERYGDAVTRARLLGVRESFFPEAPLPKPPTPSEQED